MSLVQQYFYEGAGYEPLIIADGWQVAQLNFMPELALGNINRIERHNRTDEVFVLFRGDSLLIAATEGCEGLAFEVVQMKPAVTYNIPKGVWHGIVMKPEDLVIIMEHSNTHRDDVEYRQLPDAECAVLAAMCPKTRLCSN